MTVFTINTINAEVLPLHESHIEGIIELMNKEGWYYYDVHELRRYLNLDQDCFTLIKARRVIGSIFTTNYTAQAWIGNIVIAEEERGKGLAAGLIKGTINYLQKKRNILTFRLGSVPLAIGLYKKLGFRAEAFTTSQEVELPLKLDNENENMGEHLHLERLEEEDLEAVAEIDRQFFRSDRLGFLTDLYKSSIREGCVGLKDRGKIVGFLMIRRRKASQEEGGFAEGPDHVYRLGPSCVLPKYGTKGFKALFQEGIRAVNEEVALLDGSAKIYAVFPRNADREQIFNDTWKLAEAMGMDGNINLDTIFDEHEHIFGAQKSRKNEDQWTYMKDLGFHQEYFEQVMSYTPGEAKRVQPYRRKTEGTRADPEGIFALATPGDKA